MKLLFYDIENTPNLIAAWGVREQDAVWTEKHWEMLSFAYKFAGEATKCVSREGQKTDEQLVKALHRTLSKADIVVAHNGLEFDNKKANARFLKYGLPPVRPFKTIDTLKVARKSFNLNSCSLDALADYLGVGRKIKTDKDLWRGCMRDDAAAWKLMRKYNSSDVDLLAKVYKKLLPWLGATHDSVEPGANCPKPGCESKGWVSHGHRVNAQGAYRRLQCLSCGGWAQERKASSKVKPLLRSIS